jgi:hypothetical protein
VEFQEYDAMMRRMMAIMVHMDTAIEELRTFTRQQDGINERLTAAIERLETLLQCVVRGGENGREA